MPFPRAPLFQEEDGTAGSAGAVSGRARGKRPRVDTTSPAAVAAAPDPPIEVIEPQPQPITATQRQETAEFMFEVGEPEEEKPAAAPALGTAVGTVTPPPLPNEQAAMQVIGAVEKERRKQDIMGEVALYADEDQMMLDAENLLNANQEAGEELITRSFAKYNARVQQLDNDIEALKNTRVDPNRLFTNMTGAGRFAAAFNMAVGQMAATGRGGPNAAMSLITEAINRDILAQQQNANILNQGITQARGLAGEELDAGENQIIQREKNTALAMTYTRQKIARKMGEVRTAKARRALEAFDFLLAQEVIKHQQAARAGYLSVLVKAQIKKGATVAEAVRFAKESSQQLAGAFPEQGGDLLAGAETPSFMQEAGMATEAPQAPVEAAPAPEAALPQTATQAALGGRRRPLSDIRAVVGPVTVGEAALADETVPATDAPSTEEARPVEEEVPAGTGRIPGESQLPGPKSFGGSVQKAADAGFEMHAQWLEQNEPVPPSATEEEWAALPGSVRGAYIKEVEYYNWVQEHPDMFVRDFSKQTGDGLIQNYITLRGAGLAEPGRSERFKVALDSPLLLVRGTKEESASDPRKEIRFNIKEAKQTREDAEEVVSILEKIGTVATVSLGRDKRASRLEFAAKKNDDGTIALTMAGGNAEVQANVRRLNELMISLQARFIKSFDTAARLSDKDMELAATALGVSDLESFYGVLGSALTDKDSQIQQGLQLFFRRFGERGIERFREDALDQGIIFPPATETQSRKELNRVINNIRAR